MNDGYVWRLRSMSYVFGINLITYSWGRANDESRSVVTSQFQSVMPRIQITLFV